MQFAPDCERSAGAGHRNPIDVGGVAALACSHRLPGAVVRLASAIHGRRAAGLVQLVGAVAASRCRLGATVAALNALARAGRYVLQLLTWCVAMAGALAWSRTWCRDPLGWCDPMASVLPAWSTWSALRPLAGASLAPTWLRSMRWPVLAGACLQSLNPGVRAWSLALRQIMPGPPWRFPVRVIRAALSPCWLRPGVSEVG